MKKEYTGTIVEESLEDNRILNNLNIIGFKISGDENPEDRWHLYTVTIFEEEIKYISRYIKSGTWYMHFWKEKEVVAVFKDKVFVFDYDNKETWKEAIEYGLSIGIPLEQLDFIIDENI
jgi:hypothetical protein